MPLSSPSTSLSLIRRVREQDGAAWERLVNIYGPLVYRWCRRQGVAAHDASDIMQEVFSAVSSSVDRYRSENGQQPFRGWLFGIARFKIMDHFRAAENQPIAIDGDQLEQTIAAIPDSDRYLSDPDLARNDLSVVINRTLEAISAEYTDVSWAAFWRTAVDSQPASEIARELGLKPANVRQIKFRVLKRLRVELEGLEPSI